MSGLIGWIDNTASLNGQREVVTRMAQAVSLRANQPPRIWQSERAAFGFAPLVLNAQQASYPFVQPINGGTIAVVCDGDIYNLDAIRQELMTAGHYPAASEEGEVLVQAWLHWGEDFVAWLDGDFALALWDSRSLTLLLARDPLGIKPLYFYASTSGVLFASLPQGLLANPAVSPRLERRVLPILLQPRLVMPGETPLAGVELVPPAHLICWRDGSRSMHRYWQLSSQPHQDSPAQTAQRVRELLEQSVTKRMQQENTRESVAAMLSGGLDSTSVLGLMHQQRGTGTTPAIESFCMNFDSDDQHFIASELRPDIDSPYAIKAAAFYNIPHVTVTANIGDISALAPETRRSRGLPAWGQFDASMALIFKHISQRHRLVLTGEIADEIFGGYPYFFNQALVDRDDFPWIGDGPKLIDFLDAGLKAEIDPQQDERARYRQLLDETPPLAGESAVSARMRQIFFLSLAGPVTVLLERMERMSAAQGVNVRFPFCDTALLQYLWNVPWEIKCAGGTKGLLKQAMADILPPSTLERKKSAYPHIQNPHYDQQLLGAATALVRDKQSAVAQLFDVPALSRLLEQIGSNQLQGNFPGGTKPAALLIHLIEMEQWLQDYNIQR
ncbi:MULTISPECIES: asparagine synthase (glutamine-hydrolyzing) [Xenorhabdus]|uniref:asparagine synthase (glutamine-hydrolyzing) n=1 Tax=Xenorhabdus TaxID=626 RepID=UPI00069A524A|nr:MULTISPECIES: asparagine synthase (glutamine-hydrolyzing) [Xenorhabdus]